MKVLLSILREMAPIPNEPHAVATALTRLGLAVEEVRTVGSPVPGVVNARIVRMEKHPDAAKITRCWVDAGDGEERHVWCGATNMSPGDVVPLATLGTTMPDGRAIARREILGIASEGMLCSPVELGISEEGAGLLVLPPDSVLGESPFTTLSLVEDTVFELDLTRNRPDCWGHMGIARDLAAHFGVEFSGPRLEAGPRGQERSHPVVIEAPDSCGLFSLAVISGVVVGESPDWVKVRLSRLGMRAINNVVDASNLVMLELNQPNHAYDADVVSSFVVRTAAAGETIVTLDGHPRSLDVEDLLICNGSTGAPVGLAGVMGDQHSEITETTTTLALETAWFSPDSVRFSAQRHGLRTEASIRFERGTDPHGWQRCAERFVTILRESSPSAVLHDGISVATTPSCPRTGTIELRSSQVVRTLGPVVPHARQQEILERIGFVCRPMEGGFRVDVPTWRPDCVDEVDLIEEIARHFGYDELGKSVLSSPVDGRLSTFQARRRLLRRVLVGLGLDEAMPSPFLAPGDLKRTGLDEEQALEIENPLVSDESVLRTSLRPGLLASLRYNQSHRAPRIALWEIGHVYPRSNDPLPDETEQLAIVVAGADVGTAVSQWNVIADALSVGAQLDQSRVPAGLHPTRSASLTRGKTVVGVVGEVHPAVLDAWGISGRVSVLECNLSILLAETPRPVQAKAVNRHPSSDLDMAFVVPDSVTAATLHRALRQAASSRLVGIELFDSYRGQGVPDGSRSLAFRLRLQEPGSTLTDSAVAQVMEACRLAAEKCGAQVRT